MKRANPELIHASPRGMDYYNGHGKTLDIRLAYRGVAVTLEDHDQDQKYKITVPDDVWLMFCQRLARSQEGTALILKKRSSFPKIPRATREKGEIA